MAERKNSSEEDYLDNLLNAVLNNSNEKKEEELNSDDELLGEIEGDLFDGDLSAMEALGFEESLDDGEVSVEKPKKEKKGLWGRKKKDRKKDALEAESEDIFKEAEDIENSAGIIEDMLAAEQEDILSDEAVLSDNISSEPEYIPEPEYIGDEAGSTFEDEDMQGLYDILGVGDSTTGTDEGDELDEINRLEEEKPKRKKKKEEKVKKEKDKKKSRLGKKQKGKKAEEDTEDFDLGISLGMDLSDDVNEADLEDNSDDISDTGMSLNSSMEDLGFGGLDDIFMGGEETDSPAEANTGMGMMDFEDDDMSDDEEDEEEEPKKKKKEKKEKKKKEKKEKPPKEKKPKKEKPKKEKKPKEPDQIIKIRFPFVIFCISLIVLLVVGLKLGGNYKYYMEKTDLALTYYLDKNFDAAYGELSGLELNGDDVNFFNQVETIMYVQRHYTSYKNLYSLKEYDQALFTLLRGVKMYDKYKDTAREYNCYDDMTLVLGWINAALQEKYGLTESEARELNLLDDRYEYAERIYKLADEAQAREEALEEASGE